MNQPRTARRGRLATALLVGAAMIGGTLAASASTASALLPPKTQNDVAATNTAPATATRVGAFGILERITDNGPVAAPGKMVITVSNATETGITTDAGLACDAPVLNPTTHGFSQECSTDVDAPLAALETRSASIELTPQADPHLTTIAVSNTASMPTTYADTLSTNNRVSRTVKVLDAFDLAASSSGLSTVGRAGTYGADGSITNAGADPVYARFTVVVANATEALFTPDPGFACLDNKPNLAGTGFTRACTTTSPLTSGSSLPLHLEVTPNSNYKIHGLTVSFTAAKMFGTITDPTPLGNRSTLKVAITDSADLDTSLSTAAVPGANGRFQGTSFSIDGTIRNLGPDGVAGKVIIKVTGGSILSITPDAGLTCTGTGATRTCTFLPTTPLGTTLHFTIVLTNPLPTNHDLTTTATASVLGGVTVTDPQLGNNVAPLVLPVGQSSAIT
jgi:hypothetical protein